MTVNEQLMEMYEHHFNELIQHLEADGIKFQVQPPFLLGLSPIGSQLPIFSNEEWYTKADLKVMFFGREAHIWGWRDENKSDEFVEGYEEFYGVNYNGYCFMIDTDNHLGKSPFIRGMNGLMSGIIEKLHKVYPKKRAAFLWNNISKLSSIEGKFANDKAHRDELLYFHVIPNEIRILKPDIVIFLTGFGKNGAKYNVYINENFNKDDGYPIISEEALPGVDITDVVKINIQGIPLAYKTHHPQGVSNDNLDSQYKAICKDIESHLGEIIK